MSIEIYAVVVTGLFLITLGLYLITRANLAKVREDAFLLRLNARGSAPKPVTVAVSPYRPVAK